MRRILPILFLICMSAVSAAAAGYDDFSQGLSEDQRENHDAEIAAFSAAIASPDLPAVWLPQAYRFRAGAYLAKKQCAEAFADANTALKLKPGLAEAIYVHLFAAKCLKKFDMAAGDAGLLIDEGYGRSALRLRSLLRFRMGDFAGAVADLDAFEPLARRDTYGILWLAMARARGGLTGGDAAEMGRAAGPRADARALAAHDAHWPGRLISLFWGMSKPEDVTLPGDGAPATPIEKCESDFYLGEWWLAKSDKASAKPLFQSAATNCPDDQEERDLAQAELAQIKD